MSGQFDVRAALELTGTLTDFAVLVGTSRSSVYRWLSVGLDHFEADGVANRLGVHPTAIWVDWMTPDDDFDDDDELGQLALFE